MVVKIAAKVTFNEKGVKKLMAISIIGIIRMAIIEPRTEPISVGPSLMLFYIAFPIYDPTTKLVTIIKINKASFNTEDL